MLKTFLADAPGPLSYSEDILRAVEEIAAPFSAADQQRARTQRWWSSKAPDSPSPRLSQALAASPRVLAWLEYNEAEQESWLRLASPVCLECGVKHTIEAVRLRRIRDMPCPSCGVM